ncbi:MAG: PadR family transcriptional regulator [Clostridia bacterium]|nr:PadR family transcriptional regulator [Clostridia bacterium]
MSGDFTFLKGNIETIILCALYNGDKYGYEIAKEIKDRTDNKYEIKQPTLYAYLKRLEQQELILSYWGTESAGGRRRYYKLTEQGKLSCEAFMAEWEYHKSVLSTLVDSGDKTAASSDDVTPLFGTKSRKPKKPRLSASAKAALDEQDEIARRLDALMGIGASDSDDDKDESATSTDTTPVEPVVEEVVPVVEEVVVASEAPAPAPTPVDTAPVAPLTEEVQPVATASEESAPTTSKAVLDKFVVNQDDADEFILKFDEKAKALADRSASATTTPDSGENYQHVLMGLVGGQLDEMKHYSPDDTTVAPSIAPVAHHGSLEEVANSFAKQGIRMRIYNHATATYKSKTLMPQPKVLCITSWLTYAFALIYFGIFAMVSIPTSNWVPFVITASVILVAPIAVSIYALANPIRREKPKFELKVALIATLIATLVVAMLACGVNALNNMEFSNFAELSTKVLIPVGIALLPPVFVLVYNWFYKKY